MHLWYLTPELHDQICQSVVHPHGFTIQELDLDNISGIPMSEYFLDPAFVEIMSEVSLQKTRIEPMPGELFTLTPGARLRRLCVHSSFDLRSIPLNEESR